MGFRAQSLGADSERDITGDGRQRDVALIALERIGFSVAVTTGMIGIKTGICMRRVKFVRLAVMVSQFDPETFSHGAGQGRKHENYRHQNQKRRVSMPFCRHSHDYTMDEGLGKTACMWLNSAGLGAFQESDCGLGWLDPDEYGTRHSPFARLTRDLRVGLGVVSRHRKGVTPQE